MQSLLRAASCRVVRDLNDTLRVMRWCGWLLAAACSGGPSLRIAVDHPAGYAVERTTVTVYFGGGVSCDEIELGDLTDAELAAIEVDRVDLPGNGTVEVSRLGDKAIVARGYDAEHRFVTAGCRDLGDIAGDTSVAIDTQPTASVAIDPGQPDRPFTGRDILVNLADVHGVPLDGTVSWQLTGPVGATAPPPSGGVRTRDGNVRVQVDDLGIPGPEALRIRAPWATAPLPLVTGFDLSHATTIDLGGGLVASHPSCDVRGHAGKPPTLVCLTQANLQGHRDAVEIAWQVDHYAATPIAIPGGPIGADNQFALFVDHDGSADEPVYVVSAAAGGAGSWYKLGAASAAIVAFDSSLQNVVYIPGCAGSSQAARVGVQTGAVASVANKVRFFTPPGAALGTAAMDGEVFSGGCIHDVDRNEHQGVVVAGASGDAGLALITPGGSIPIAGTRLTGSGFVTVEAQGVIEKRFAGTRLQASGTVVFEAVLAPVAAPGGPSYELLERTEVDAAAPPIKIIGGKLDGDGDTDLMWDMAVGVRRRLFQVSLAEQVRGAPLTALTSGPGAIATATANEIDFAAADLSGGGTDEMIVFTAAAVTIYSPDE